MRRNDFKRRINLLLIHKIGSLKPRRLSLLHKRYELKKTIIVKNNQVQILATLLQPSHIREFMDDARFNERMKVETFLFKSKWCNCIYTTAIIRKQHPSGNPDWREALFWTPRDENDDYGDNDYANAVGNHQPNIVTPWRFMFRRESKASQNRFSNCRKPCIQTLTTVIVTTSTASHSSRCWVLLHRFQWPIDRQLHVLAIPTSVWMC